MIPHDVMEALFQGGKREIVEPKKERRFQPYRLKCVLYGDHIFVPEYPHPIDVWRKKERRNSKWYVSFFYDAYRYWRDWVQEGIEFEARRTNDHQFHGGSGHHNNTYQRHKAGRR